MKKNNGSYFSADEMKRLCDDAFGRVFPEVVQMEKIEKEKGLSWLPEKLRETAILRKEHPDMSLTALGALFDPPLKKSGINSRLKKIEEIASKL